MTTLDPQPQPRSGAPVPTAEDASALTPASGYPQVPVLAYFDDAGHPSQAHYVFGYLIPLADQWAYDCEGCGGARSVVVWGPDYIAECADCLRPSQEEGGAPSIVVDKAVCHYCSSVPDDGVKRFSSPTVAIVEKDGVLRPACRHHAGRLRSGETLVCTL